MAGAQEVKIAENEMDVDDQLEQLAEDGISIDWDEIQKAIDEALMSFEEDIAKRKAAKNSDSVDFDIYDEDESISSKDLKKAFGGVKGETADDDESSDDDSQMTEEEMENFLTNFMLQKILEQQQAQQQGEKVGKIDQKQSQKQKGQSTKEKNQKDIPATKSPQKKPVQPKMPQASTQSNSQSNPQSDQPIGAVSKKPLLSGAVNKIVNKAGGLLRSVHRFALGKLPMKLRTSLLGFFQVSVIPLLSISGKILQSIGHGLQLASRNMEDDLLDSIGE